MTETELLRTRDGTALLCERVTPDELQPGDQVAILKDINAVQPYDSRFAPHTQRGAWDVRTVNAVSLLGSSGHTYTVWYADGTSQPTVRETSRVVEALP